MIILSTKEVHNKEYHDFEYKDIEDGSFVIKRERAFPEKFEFPLPYKRQVELIGTDLISTQIIEYLKNAYINVQEQLRLRSKTLKKEMEVDYSTKSKLIEQNEGLKNEIIYLKNQLSIALDINNMKDKIEKEGYVIVKRK